MIVTAAVHCTGLINPFPEANFCACNPAARLFARELTKTEPRRSVRSLHKPPEIVAL